VSEKVVVGVKCHCCSESLLGEIISPLRGSVRMFFGRGA
jgi:hypothetical protein